MSATFNVRKHRGSRLHQPPKRGYVPVGIWLRFFFTESVMKAILVAIAIALGAYGAIGMEAAQQSHSTVQKSLDRMSAVEATLK